MEQNKFLPEGVIDLSQYRKKKEQEAQPQEPLFTEPTMITLGDPENPDLQVRYVLLVNLVMDGKQYLALESLEKGEEGQVAIVEAIVENNQLVGVKAVDTDEEYEQLVGIMTKALELNTPVETVLDISGEERENDSND